MAIEFNCPNCGKLLTTSDERASARAKCPACDELITVPAPSPSLVGGIPSEALAATAAWSASPEPELIPLPAAKPAAMASTIHSSAELPAGATPGAFVSEDPRLATVCRNCRSVMAAGATYCSTCGAPLWEAGPPLRYAPVWRRVVAWFIDVVIIVLTANFLKFVVPRGSWVAEDIGFVIWFLYTSALESSPEQATVGKRLMGIMVCGTDGRRLSFPRAAIRTAGKLLSLLSCGIGFIMPLLTLRRQALHDLLTDTVVVEK